ncbi:hypothetical protein [Natronolimnohabitans innermongolicus]|uniref:MarR family transcriptional regulator n=1 Tax=Natronolimnohabitans innermongolicus JCM 12255 TaxID=1227499 RepID=L9X280_9EURY|nr:hypothetical protein [Natronolimnohabitans innermongolicus]ELY55874.1 hypothetical protein C493_10363 [Natronolimnohabitans innermongolicus JCM 12255]
MESHATTVTTTATATELRRLPAEIDSTQGKLVYLSLEATEGATLEELEALLTLKKLTILSVLNCLSSRELIDKRGDTYVTN